MNIINEKITLPNGKEISIETGKLAKQADGSVVVRMGDTMILATAVANIDVRDGVDFMPLFLRNHQETCLLTQISLGNLL